MLLDNFMISIVIFAYQANFSTLYIGKPSSNQDHYYLGGYCMACHVKIFWNCKKNVSWISPGNLVDLEIIYSGFVDTVLLLLLLLFISVLHVVATVC